MSTSADYLGASQAVQSIASFARCPDWMAADWVTASGLPDDHLLWLADVIASLPYVAPTKPSPKFRCELCAHCGCQFEYEQVTRPRRYCSRACQDRAYRLRKAEFEIRHSVLN